MTGTFLNIALRSGLIYLVVLVGLRLLGKRHVAQLSILDFVLILLISNAVQNAMVGDDSSLAGGIVAAVTLLLLNYLFSTLLYRSKKVELLFEGTPTLLVHDGQAIPSHLAEERITEEELVRVVREHGIEHLTEVKAAIMELDGTISVIPRTGGEKKIETFKHRRSKLHQRKD